MVGLEESDMERFKERDITVLEAARLSENRSLLTGSKSSEDAEKF